MKIAAANAKARHAEVARRYRRPFNFASLRVRELSQLCRLRHDSDLLTDDDAGRDYFRIIACHLARSVGDPLKKIVSAASLRAPWLTEAEARSLAEEVIACPRKWTASALGVELRLLYAERQHLGLTTIAPIDVSKAQRAKLAKQQRADRQRAKRRAAGMKARTEYEKSAMNRAKPWEAKNMSRRTWYRRKKAAASPLAQVCDAQGAVNGHPRVVAQVCDAQDLICSAQGCATGRYTARAPEGASARH